MNRATLARQMLLERERLDVVAAVSRVGGLQAQEPASPYLALWARVADLDAAQLTAALAERALIKATLHRSTLHIASATDYLASITALTRVLRTKWMNEARGLPVNRTLPELAEQSLAFAAVPRANIEMREHAGTLGEPVPADELWRRIRRYALFVGVPGEHPWSFGRRPVHVAARSWLEAEAADEDASLEHVVRSHLRAFGPARLADVAQWSGLSVARLRVGERRLEDLRRYTDEDGRELLDLPDATLPDPETPAPPRLLPMWDETLLAYADRSRILPEAYRQRVIVKGGDVLPTVLVDGMVAGSWWVEADPGGRPRVILETFADIEASDRAALEVEGAGLVDFIAAREPDVYSRYRHTARRP